MKDQLIQAIEGHDTETALQILEAHPHLAKADNNEGISLLLMASYYRNTQLVKALLAHRERLNAFEAAATGQLNHLQHTVTADNVNDFAGDGFTVLGLTCFFGHFECAEWLIVLGANVDLAADNDFKVAPLHSATANNDIKIVLLLLENGANVNIAQHKGITALHAAAHHNQEEIVKALLSHGADFNLQTDAGQNALMMASDNGHTSIVDLLQAL